MPPYLSICLRFKLWLGTCSAPRHYINQWWKWNLVLQRDQTDFKGVAIFWFKILLLWKLLNSEHTAYFETSEFKCDSFWSFWIQIALLWKFLNSDRTAMKDSEFRFSCLESFWIQTLITVLKASEFKSVKSEYSGFNSHCFKASWDPKTRCRIG